MTDRDETDMDIVPEDEEETPDVVKKLRTRLKECQEERQEYLDGWQRAKADAVNARKQGEERQKAAISFANQDLLEQLIPVLDSFEMAFANKAAWEQVDPTWRGGVESIHTQLITVLQDNGFTLLDPVGMPFDPAQHESVGMVETAEEKEDHHVAEVVQKGYVLYGRVIRPANVRVFEKPKE